MKPDLEKQGFTEEDSAKILANAYFALRSSKSLHPDEGLTKENLDQFWTQAQPIIVDSAPRGALVQTVPDGGYPAMPTRCPVLLKPGQQIKIRLTLAGYKDYEEIVIAGQTKPVICRELQPARPEFPKSRCPQ